MPRAVRAFCAYRESMWGNQLARLSERVRGLHDLMLATFVTHRTLLDSQAQRVQIALDAADKAVSKSETSVNDRLAAMNEFRASLADAQATFLTRAEFEQFRAGYAEAHAQLRDQFGATIGELKERIDKAEGRSGGFSGAWAVVVAVVSIGVAVGALVFRSASG